MKKFQSGVLTVLAIYLLLGVGLSAALAFGYLKWKHTVYTQGYTEGYEKRSAEVQALADAQSKVNAEASNATAEAANEISDLLKKNSELTKKVKAIRASRLVGAPADSGLLSKEFTDQWNAIAKR